MWDNFEFRIRKLRKAFEDREKFVLFLGAGQNGGYNVRLLWNDLIRDSCKISFRQLFQQIGLGFEDSRAILRAMGVEGSEAKNDEKLVNYLHSHFPVEIQVSIIKALMKNHYIPTLQSQLYGQCNYEVIKKAFSLYSPIKDFPDAPEGFRHLLSGSGSSGKELYTLFVIARMILLNPQIKSVITYNFDNFVRQAVRVLLVKPENFFTDEEIGFLNIRYGVDDGGKLADKVKIVDVYGDLGSLPTTRDYNVFPVYHVHGYIPDPNEEEITENLDIVLALEDFVEQQTGGLSWQDAVQIKAFHDSNILFIGCSMTDLTMKRMINYAHTQGYSNKIFILGAAPSDQNADTQRRMRALEELRVWYFDTLGASCVNCPDGYGRLFDELYKINHANQNKR